jgi:hypothetical protein
MTDVLDITIDFNTNHIFDHVINAMQNKKTTV